MGLHGEWGKIVGLWAKAKEVKGSMSGLFGEQKPRQDDSHGEAVQVAEAGLEADPMQGHSEIWASELIDDKTCAKCAENDGHEYTSVAEAREDYPAGEYPAGGYRHCESETGCRGTLVFLREGN